MLGNQLPDESCDMTNTNNVSQFSVKTQAYRAKSFVLLTTLKVYESVCLCLKVMNEDDVIYADIILPVLPGSDSMRVHECEFTEYACVRYNQSAVQDINCSVYFLCLQECYCHVL